MPSRHEFEARPNPWLWFLRVAIIVVRSLLPLWPLWLVAALWCAPSTPGFRWSYSYQDYAGRRIYLACSYVSVHGLIPRTFGADCPLFVIFDREDFQA